MTGINKKKIMVIDDDDHDLAMMKRCLLKSKLDIDLIMFNDSIEAQEYLSLNNPPSLIFLDLNMPKKSGEQLLREIRQQGLRGSIPIIVILSSSDREKDVSDCYALGSNSYLVKPFNLQELSRVLQTTCDYWFNTAILPYYSNNLPN